MAYIQIKDNLPGIVGLLYSKPGTGKAVSTLAQAILRGPSPLSIMERELIASYVSSLNGCRFCYDSHSAIVDELESAKGFTNAVIDHAGDNLVSAKMKALLRIAGKVQKNGRDVLPEDIELAKNEGASEDDIHDTVIVAAAFCFFNRYVDGLHTEPLKQNKDYVEPARSLIKFGYAYPGLIGRYFMKKMFRGLMAG
jgi:uncharacterized peroxidase-related enzyme